VISSVVYLNADHEKFYFDSRMIVDDLRVHDFSYALEQFGQRLWQPDSQLTYLTFAVNYAINESLGLAGNDVTGFLVANVLIHALNVCLVYLLLRALLRQVTPDPERRVWLPLALATLFAVHPLHAASVAYILQRRGMMVVTFYLLALLVYLRFRTADRPGHRGGLLLLLALLFWLSFKSKAMGLTLPFAILALEFCFRAGDPPALKRFLRLLIPGLLASAVLMFFFLWTKDLFDPKTFRILSLADTELWGAWPHLLTESRVFAHWWKLILLPLPRWMSIDHDFLISYRLLDHHAWAAVLFHGLLIGGAVVAAFKRYLIGAFGVMLFYVAVIPWVLLPQTEPFVEYKTYLSMIGVVLLLAELLGRVRVRPMIVVTVFAAALLLATTVRRNVVYQSALNLWTDALEKAPDRSRPHINLGLALVDLGRFDEAIEHYAVALGRQLGKDEPLRYNPGNARAYTNLGVALARQGRTGQAIALYREVARKFPNSFSIRSNLGALLAEQGQISEAIDHYRAALRARPDTPETHNNLANALLALGRTEDAITHFRRAMRLKPDIPETHNNLATALAQQGKIEEALRYYTAAIGYQPDYFEPHKNLAVLLARQGRIDEALAECRAALSLQPASADMHFLSGTLLSQMGAQAEAEKAFRLALKFDPRHAPARRELQALQAGGNPPGAPQPP
jgi:tetratricopeptide (TPR) repeat protein